MEKWTGVPVCAGCCLSVNEDKGEVDAILYDYRLLPPEAVL